MNKFKRLPKIKVILLIVMGLIFVVSKYSLAVQWVKTYGGPNNYFAQLIQQTSDGGYVVAGWTSSFGAGNTDVWVLKLDGNGNVQWQKTYGGSGSEYLVSAQQTADGGYIVLSSTESFGAGDCDAWVLKLDSNGNVQWQKTYGGSGYDFPMTIRQIADGFVVVGYTMPFVGSSVVDGWILKLDNTGNIQWQRRYAGTYGPGASDIQQTADGGYIIAGSVKDNSSTGDGWILKLDNTGNIQWQRRYGAIGNDNFLFLQITDSGYIVAGETTSFGAGYNNIWVLNLNYEGTIIWQRTYSRGYFERANFLEHSSDGGFLVGGASRPFGGNTDAWLLKLNTDGTIAWQKTYGGSGGSTFTSIKNIVDGYIAVGSSTSFGAGSYIWVLKLSESGEIFGCTIVDNSQAIISNSSVAISNSNTSDQVGNFTESSGIFFVTDTSVEVSTICMTAPPPPPALIFPANGSTVSSKTINLDWEDVTGAVRYEVCMDNNSGFGSPEFCKEVAESNLSLGNWVPDNVYYWKVRAVFSDGSTSAWSETWQFTYHLTVSPRPVFVPIYRLYNGCCQTDHFYTTSTKQRDIALNSSKNCDSPPCPSYPSYYKFEKIECYASDRNFPGGVPVMRLNSDTRSCHYYTTDEADKDSKLANLDDGFIYEGIAFFVYPTQVLGSVPVYHLFRDDTPVPGNYDNFYTISEFERDNAVASFGYQYTEGDILGYAMPYDPSMSQNPAGHAGQGINTENGNFRTYENTDFSMPGRNLPLAFTRVYNSLYTNDAVPLGFGWTHSYNIYLYDHEGSVDGSVVVYWGDGSQDVYLWNGTSYIPGPGIYDKLNRVDANTYTITRKDQTVYTLIRLPSDMPNPGDEATKPARYKLKMIQEKNGNTITCNYNSAGDLYQIVDTVGRSLTITHDAQHRITNITDPISRNVQFTYDAVGDLVSSRDARGNMTQYKYDSNAENAHRMFEIIKPRGNKVQMAYDESHRVASQKIGDATDSIRFDYVEPSNQTNITYPATSHSPGGIASHVYDEDHPRLTSVEDPDRNTASWAYTDPVNAMKPSSFSDKKGCPSNYTYDERGNMLTVTDCLNHSWTYTYDDKNNLLTSKDPQNHTVAYEYDPNGNLIKIIDAAGNQTTMTYTPYGQLETVTNANEHTTTYTYDTQGNLIRMTDPEANQTNYTYDAAGRKISMTDANSHPATYDYDNNDNLIRVQPPTGSLATYDYDTNNNLEAIHFAGGTVRFTYNDKDLLASETDQLSYSTYYTYDDLGHLTQKTDANGNNISYYYDALGRLANINYPGGTTVSFEYDENSNLKSTIDQHGTSTFTYDELNRIKSYTNNYVGKIVSYDYDEVGNRKKITYPDSKDVNYTYDENDRLETVKDRIGGITRYEYDSTGNLISITNPNGTTTAYGYDLAERLTALANRKPDTSIINSYSYVLDGVGNHLQENRTETLTPTINRKNTSYTYDLSNRLLTAGSATYGCDNNGNMTSKNNGGLITNYIFDNENRLTQVASEANTTSYKYDGLGNRIARIQNGNETKYLLDLNGSMSQVLAETDSSGNITDYYVYGLGLISRIGSDNTRHVYHSDSRGSTIAMTDGLGNISHQYTYDEFGNLSGISEADTNLFRYVGGYGVMDEGNGLYFMRARYYEPEAGRFINKDPLGFDGGDLNLYGYVKGNPILKIDPKGLTNERLRIISESPTQTSMSTPAIVIPDSKKLTSQEGKRSLEKQIRNQRLWYEAINIWIDIAEATATFTKNITCEPLKLAGYISKHPAVQGASKMCTIPDVIEGTQTYSPEEVEMQMIWIMSGAKPKNNKVY